LAATSQNGSTSQDRTNYYQTVPKEALDTILWLESDRMGHFLGALTQARLDEQRGVVQNEKRRGQNAPYAIAQDLTIRATYPEEHPYGHSVIGSMDDLNAASLEQVREWFRTYYGPSNAVIALSVT
jgi:zinc protease